MNNNTFDYSTAVECIKILSEESNRAIKNYDFLKENRREMRAVIDFANSAHDKMQEMVALNFKLGLEQSFELYEAKDE